MLHDRLRNRGSAELRNWKQGAESAGAQNKNTGEIPVGMASSEGRFARLEAAGIAYPASQRE
jgi:hypothetical protein